MENGYLKKMATVFGIVVVQVMCLACHRVETVLNPADQISTLRLPDSVGERYGVPYSYEHKIRADVLLARGDWHGAVAEYEAALDGDPVDFYLRTEFARILMEMGQMDRAKKHLAKAILFEPTAQVAWVVLADLHQKTGNDKKAVEAAMHGVRVDRASSEALEWLGDYYSAKGKPRQAIEYYRQGIAIGATHRDIMLKLADAEQSMGHKEAASDLLEKYLFLGGSDSKVVLEIAKNRIKSGDGTGGVRLWEAILSAGSEPDAIREELIHHLLQMEMNSRALFHIRSLDTVDENDISKVVKRASLFLDAKSPWEAREVIDESLAEWPVDESLLLILAEIELALCRNEAAALLLNNPSVTWSLENKKKVESLKKRLD